MQSIKELRGFLNLKFYKDPEQNVVSKTDHDTLAFWQFGSKAFTVDKEDNIYVDNAKYQGTEGFFELIF